MPFSLYHHNQAMQFQSRKQQAENLPLGIVGFKIAPEKFSPAFNTLPADYHQHLQQTLLQVF